MFKKMQQTWTYNHKHLLVTLGLLAAVIWQSGIITVTLPKNTTVYAQVTTPTSLDAEIEQRARELRDQFADVDLEIYRQKAITEMNEKLVEVSKNSPFLDDETMAHYGL